MMPLIDLLNWIKKRDNFLTGGEEKGEEFNES